MEEVLSHMGLSEYSQTFEPQGYDDVGFVKGCTVLGCTVNTSSLESDERAELVKMFDKDGSSLDYLTRLDPRDESTA